MISGRKRQLEYILPGTDVRVVRSRRKTLSVRIEPAGPVIRAPLFCTDAQIRAFLEQHRRWIRVHTEQAGKREREAARLGTFTEEELSEMKALAASDLPPRVRRAAALLGRGCGRITVRFMTSRWGSCSADGGIRMNALLMLAPPMVRDAVAAHEACHLLEMNHGEAFYRHLRAVCPAWEESRRWLKTEGSVLLLRLRAGNGGSGR